MLSRAALKTTLGKRCSSLYSPENLLNEENIKRTVAKFSALKPIRLNTQVPAKKAAILIPVCIVDGKISLLYTLRAASLKSHRAQVSFPGGMQDSTDKNLEHTALRECQEELGIDPDEIKVWGSGNYVVTRQDACVLPVIGQFESPLNINSLKTNPKEVEQVFTVSLEDLSNPKNIGFTQFRGSYSIPVFLGGAIRIWGLTALITNGFLSSFLPPQSYFHRVKFTAPIKISKLNI